VTYSTITPRAEKGRNALFFMFFISVIDQARKLKTIHLPDRDVFGLDIVILVVLFFLPLENSSTFPMYIMWLLFVK
jgi:hypothetical protein